MDWAVVGTQRLFIMEDCRWDLLFAAGVFLLAAALIVNIIVAVGGE